VPPLEINQSRYINASVRLDEPIAAQFAQYAAFTRASADDFVDEALNYVLSKDSDLADFLKTPQAKQADSTLRICKGASKDAGEHPGWWLTSSARPLGFVPVLGGWILDSISRWCKHGASHRKNFDTPPLEGNCRATFVARWLPLETDDLQKPGS
jgi:hypothetical protein